MIRIDRGDLSSTASLRARETERERERETDQSSEAMPRSLQHLMRALLLHPSVAVGIPFASKNVCSPRATLTNLDSTKGKGGK